MKFKTRKRKYIVRARRQWRWGKVHTFRFIGPFIIETRRRTRA
jgi:hypothetical protein